MTKEEAKQWIESIKRKYIHGGDEEFDYKRKIALDMAINALEDEQSAKWILLSDKDLNGTFDFLHKGDAYMNYECSNCGHRVYNELRGYGDNRTTYCPNCGAKMEKGANHEDKW